MDKRKKLFEDDWKSPTDESKMAKMQLKSILANAQELLDKIDAADQLDAWVQSYLTKADDYLESVKKYVAYGQEETTVLQPIPVPNGAGPQAGAEPIMPSIVDFQPDMMAEPAADLTAEPEEGPVPEPEMEEPEEVEEPEEIEEPEEVEEPEEEIEPMGEPSSRAQFVGGGDAEMGPEDMGGDEEDDEMEFMDHRGEEDDEMTFDDVESMDDEEGDEFGEFDDEDEDAEEDEDY